MEPIQLSVKQLNMYVRSVLEGDKNLSALTLFGELSNVKSHYSSGHLYFVLKDADAAVRCVMFRTNAQHVHFAPQDGMQVVCRGYVSLYERDGQFQFYAESMAPLGQGNLAAEFERVKACLAAEGLFDPERKRPIPSEPSAIGIITAKDGAALQDIINIITRRYPLCRMVVFPCLVQGAYAPESISRALDAAYSYPGLDTLIVGRGGGSAEDLSCFNNEQLARKIARSPVPVISAVGHETDFTVCDFVSDLRAPTPSAAAELAVPSADEVRFYIESCSRRMRQLFMNKLTAYEDRLRFLTHRPCFCNPLSLYAPHEAKLDHLIKRLNAGYRLYVASIESRLNRVAGRLDALSPQATLDRGFAVAFRQNEIIKSADEVRVGDHLRIQLAKGSIRCVVAETETEEQHG